jgi:coenzyme F420-reducing hydrogenase alpha subunit
MDIVIGENGEIKKAAWEVWEPPRFFEAFLVGRKVEEAPELVQRICGICPHAHHISSLRSMERAMGIKVSEQTRLMRELMHYSDWIMSHALHIYCLAAPDFVGYESVVAMAGNPDLLPIVGKALNAKRLGNDMIVAICGNEIQNRTSVLGGYTAVPSKATLQALKERLKAAKEFGVETVKLAASLADAEPYKSLERKTEYVSLYDPQRYPINEGRLYSNEGLNVPDEDYPIWILEKHVESCNCKHATLKGRGIFATGPLMRVNNNFNTLSADAKKAAAEVGFSVPCFKPFMSIVARAIELIHAIDASIELIDVLGEPKLEEIRYEYKAGESYAITEAARGICCHGGRVDKNGIIQKYDIVAPTARNIAALEADFQAFIPKLVNLPDDELTLKCEMMIRNYDPCQSCATHSIKVNLRREK